VRLLRHSPACAAALCERERLVEWDLTLITQRLYWLRHQLFEHILNGLLTYPSSRPHGTYVIQRGPGFRKSNKLGMQEIS
jgi:hypothetical protein